MTKMSDHDLLININSNVIHLKEKFEDHMVRYHSPRATLAKGVLLVLAIAASAITGVKVF